MSRRTPKWTKSRFSSCFVDICFFGRGFSTQTCTGRYTHIHIDTPRGSYDIGLNGRGLRSLGLLSVKTKKQ